MAAATETLPARPLAGNERVVVGRRKPPAPGLNLAALDDRPGRRMLRCAAIARPLG
jgi:hypothetical protein